ncbi:MAG: hypothetical protein ACR2IK_16380 [Chloroflexota bacterium]
MPKSDLLETSRTERRPEDESTAPNGPESGSTGLLGAVPPAVVGGASREEALLQLQQMYGNAYVQRLVAEQVATREGTAAAQPGAQIAVGELSEADTGAPPPADAQVEVAQEQPQVQAPTSADVQDQPPAQMLEQAGAGALQSLKSSAAQAAPASVAGAPPASPAASAVPPTLGTSGPVDLGLAPPQGSAPVAPQAAAELQSARNGAAQLGSAAVAFAPAPEEAEAEGAATSADPAAANDMLANFMAIVADRAQQIADVSSGVPETVQAASDAATQSISAHVDEQTQAISAHIETLRAQAGTEAQSARDAVLQEFTTTSAVVTQATTVARQAVESEYNAALQAVDTREAAQLQVIDDRYRAGDQRFREAGRVVGDEAVQRGKQMAEHYMDGLVDEDDSFLDGPLTYNRGKARAETATQMGEGYQKGLQDEANKQADQAQQGKAHDVGVAQTTAGHAREAMASQYDAVLKTLADAEAAALQQAEQARAGLFDGIDQALQGASQALEQQQAALLQGVRDSAQAQSAAIAQQSDQLIGAVHGQLAQAASGVVDSGSAVAAQLQGQAAPQLDVLGAALADATAKLDAGLAQVQSDVGDAVASGQQQLAQAADAVGDGLASSSQTGMDGATQAAAEITATLQALGASAVETLGNVQQSHDSVLASTSTAASGGFGRAVDGVQQAYDAMSAGLERGFAENAAGLEQGLRGALPKMEDELRIKAEENASHVPPRWKSVVKWVLIIAVMVVVALVVGPFVIGAVGAMLGTGAVMTGIIAGAIVGGIASATIQVINNWAENKPLGEGVLKAAVIGAIGGAVGGGFGAWVGQLGQQGVSIANTAFRQFALNTVANIVTENSINIATGNFSWASFGMSIVSAVAVGGAMHALSGLKPISNLQQSSMATGEGVGGAALTGLGGTVEINYRPTQAAPKIAPEDTAVPSSTAKPEPADAAAGGGSPTQMVADDSAHSAAAFERLKAQYAMEEITGAEPTGSALKGGSGDVRSNQVVQQVEITLPDGSTKMVPKRVDGVRNVSMDVDVNHSAPIFEQPRIAEDGRIFPLQGSDGKWKNLTQMPGEVNGRPGIHEYIVDEHGNLTHQQFVPGGEVTGVPGGGPPKASAAPNIEPEGTAPPPPASTTQPADPPARPGSPTQTVPLDEIPGGPRRAANDNAEPPPSGPDRPSGGAGHPLPVEEPPDRPRSPAANDNNEPEALARTGTDDARPPASPDRRKFEVLDGGGGRDGAPRAIAGDPPTGEAPTGTKPPTLQTGEPTSSQAVGSASEKISSPILVEEEAGGGPIRPATEDPAAKPTLSKVRALRDAGIPQAERRSMFEKSRGVYDIDAVKPLPDGDNVALTPYRAGAVKPQGQEIQFGFAPFEDFDQIHLQAKQLNARLLNEPRFANLAEAIPELEGASGIIFFAKPGMMSGNPLTAAEMQFVLSSPAILAKTTFVTGFFP